MRNFGPWPVSSVTLIAALPAALESPVYVPMVGSYDPGTGSWTGLDLPPGQMATLRLEATVASGAAGSVSTAATVAPPAGVTDLVPGNNAGTDVDVVAAGATELAHGTSRRARLDASGERYFAMRQQPWSSYEVLVDEVSGDLGSVAAPVRLQRLGDGAVVLAEAQAATGVGFARSLRWRTPASVVDDGQAIRVRSSGCGSDCGADDHFRIRAYDTTCDVPRFNNALGQTTVLILQNVGRDPVTGTVDFWSATGAPLAQSTFSSLPAGATHILATSTLAALAGQSGSITVASDAPYGTLAGKAVSIDPATGFAFDTPMRARPR